MPSPLAPAQRRPRLKTHSFRQQFDALELQRATLLARLQALGLVAQEHPARHRIHQLLNASFRRGSLQQRAAVLEAAAWLINVLDRLTTTL